MGQVSGHCSGGSPRSCARRSISAMPSARASVRRPGRAAGLAEDAAEQDRQPFGLGVEQIVDALGGKPGVGRSDVVGEDRWRHRSSSLGRTGARLCDQEYLAPRAGRGEDQGDSWLGDSRSAFTLATAALALRQPRRRRRRRRPSRRTSSTLTTLPDPNDDLRELPRQPHVPVDPKGLTIYDIAKPEAPKEVGRLPLPHFENEDVDTNGEILLISNDPSEGAGILYVIDVSDPDAARGAVDAEHGHRARRLRPRRPARAAAHRHRPHRQCIKNCQFVYLAGTSKGIDIVDLRDPANPKMAGNFAAAEATGLRQPRRPGRLRGPRAG